MASYPPTVPALCPQAAHLNPAHIFERWRDRVVTALASPSCTPCNDGLSRANGRRMRKSKFTEAQIVAILRKGKPACPWRSAAAAWDQPGDLLLWRSKYAGTTVPELRRIKELEGALLPGQGGSPQGTRFDLSGRERERLVAPAHPGGVRSDACFGTAFQFVTSDPDYDCELKSQRQQARLSPAV